MDAIDKQSVADHEDAEAVGTLLADAFLARVIRFSPSARRRLLVACHDRILQSDRDIARLLFSGKPLMPTVESSLPIAHAPPVPLQAETH